MSFYIFRKCKKFRNTNFVFQKFEFPKNMQIWNFSKQNVILKIDNFKFSNNKFFKVRWMAKFGMCIYRHPKFLLVDTRYACYVGPKKQKPAMRSLLCVFFFCKEDKERAKFLNEYVLFFLLKKRYMLF